MLFTYRYLKNHRIEQLQNWLDYLFIEVWCKAEEGFDISKLDGCPMLKAVVEEFYNSRSIGGKLFNQMLEDVYKTLIDWTEAEKTALAESYCSNNDIEALCEGKAGVHPLTYKEMAQKDEALAQKLKQFYKALYTDIIYLTPITSRIGKIDEHYRDFVKENDEDRCPYCGIHSIKGQYVSKREAYDHFLPKDIYPFNSVNFKNLSPMCHECNSTYKLAKDPLYLGHRDPLFDQEDRRRKAIFPFCNSAPVIEIKIEINSHDIQQLNPEEMDLTFESVGYEEQLNVWKDIFGVEERYKATCCGKNDGEYWYFQILEELDGFDNAIDRHSKLQERMNNLRRRAAKYPWADLNFIKLPFLEGCERAGLLNR